MILKSDDPDHTDIAQYFPPGLLLELPLAHGDFAFWSGDGELAIGIERKRMTPPGREGKRADLIQSLVVGNRLVQQIRDAREDYQIQYLIAEGIWRPSPEDGLLEMQERGNWVVYDNPPIPYSRLDSCLNSIEILEGVHVKRTSNARETAATIINLFHWWQKDLGEHTTTKVFHHPSLLIGKMSLVRRVANELDGIGWELSEKVEKHFRSVEEMVEAGEKEWAKIEKIGKKKARAIVEAAGWKKGSKWDEGVDSPD